MGATIFVCGGLGFMAGVFASFMSLIELEHDQFPGFSKYVWGLTGVFGLPAVIGIVMLLLGYGGQ